MNRVSVLIGPPVEGGRLHPEYVDESDILAVTSEMPGDWVYGVDIDGNIVFDLTARRYLANFDIHIGRRLWTRGSVRNWPERVASGTIIFSDETVAQKSLNSSLRLVYDDDQRILHVAFGRMSANAQLELSRDCVALLFDDELVGFLLRGF